MLDPVLLFFLLGLAAGLLRSELRLPAAVYDLVSMLLLLAIGLKGGIELARQPFGELALQALAVIAMGALLPLLAFPVLRFAGRLPRADAASIAAHYGKVGGAATGMAFSFATTYALGQVAKRYYAGGRVMNTALLRQTFQDLLGPAKQMQTQYLPQIQQQARSLDMAQVMNLVRGR
jgi:hypothetical protein